MRAFPFPDKIGSREELKRDLLYRKIPPEDCEPISDRAWETGERAATEILAAHPGRAMAQIAAAEGLEVEVVPRDNVAGNVRYFSEYYSGRKKIVLYAASIKLWAKENGMSEQQARELILSHEIYHHLECTRLGLTSRQYTVPTLRVGGLRLGRSGIRALSEIGAHGFSRTYYDNTGRLPEKQAEEGKRLLNHAVSDAVYSGKRTARRIFEQNPILGFLTGKSGGKHR